MRTAKENKNLLKTILISPLLLLIFIYQRLISPLFPPACRHMPSCSEYANDAFRLHGPFNGGVLATKRILRCHPWGTHGFDPVPWFFFERVDLKKYQKTKKAGKSCDRLKH
jgi:hypothetical protein